MVNTLTHIKRITEIIIKCDNETCVQVHVLCDMFVFIFSVPQQMDGEGKHDVHSETHLQVSDAACKYSESTDSDVEQKKMNSVVSSDCEMSAHIPTHLLDDYNVFVGIRITQSITRKS